MTRIITPDDLTLARHVATGYGDLTDSDLESAAMTGLLNAAATFDADAGQWRPHAIQGVKWAILKHLRRRADEPIDPATLPDTAQPIGMQPDAPIDPRVYQLRIELELMNAEYLLDGVDRRRMAHRGALTYLRRALS